MCLKNLNISEVLEPCALSNAKDLLGVLQVRGKAPGLEQREGRCGIVDVMPALFHVLEW